MAWTLIINGTGDWTPNTVTLTYVDMYYWLDDYVLDDEWTITPELSGTWTLVP